MDPGSSASRSIAAPSGALDQLPGPPERFRALLDARSLTEARLADLRGKVDKVSLPDGTSLVLFGSWGRAELTDESDVDWALIVDDPDLAVTGPAVSQAVERLRTLLEGEGKPPGGQQVFGCGLHGWRLVDHIGLAEDDSANITRRLLLLLESVAVTSPHVHDGLKRRVLERYLTGHNRSHRPPRFLLNDVVRYWRTIGVDFEGKVAQDLREGRGEGKFVMRNAKLRTSRKMLNVSGLLPVLLCHYVASRGHGRLLGRAVRGACNRSRGTRVPAPRACRGRRPHPRRVQRLDRPAVGPRESDATGGLDPGDAPRGSGFSSGPARRWSARQRPTRPAVRDRPRANRATIRHHLTSASEPSRV